MKPAQLLLIGAGLGNTLLAYRLLQKNPRADLLLLEAEAGPRADRTWSFHESDLEPGVWQWLAPLAARVWDGYDVKFPAYARELNGARYASLRGADLLERTGLLARVRWNTTVRKVEPGAVTLGDGSRLTADAVVDGRGFPAWPAGGAGYQKFFGQQLRLSAPHGLTRPIVMDATVPQSDGYRFFYLLPWDETRLLVEDTYYADDPAIDPARCRAEIATYVSTRGWKIAAVEGEETAALPIPLFSAATHPAPWAVGTAGGFFHPVTGYSLPYAAAVAEAWDPLAADSAEQLWHLRQNLTRANPFYRALNRMLFLAARGPERRRIFEKFYRLSEPLVQRFYRGQSSLVDGARILSGRPPVRVAPALRAMWRKEAAL